MKKKIISLILAVCMTVCMTACGGGGSQGSAQKEGDGKETAETSEAGEAPAENLTLKLGITAPAGSFQHDVALKLDENLQEISGGTMKLDIQPGGVLGNTASHYSQMAQGTLDIFMTGFDTAGALKDASDFQVVTVPFLFDDLDHYKKFLASDTLQEMIGKVEAANGLHFGGIISDQAPRALTTANTPVEKVEDVKNLKIRCPESPAIVDVWTELGANPLIIGGGELFSALQSGQADGQDNDIINSYTSSFAEVQKYFIKLDYIYSDLLLWLSQKTWDKMTDEQKDFYTQAVEKTYEEMSDKVWNELYASCEQGFIDDGVTIIDPDKSGFLAVAEKYAAEKDGELWTAGLYEEIRNLK